MKTTPDYDLAPYLAKGRQLRSQAFLAAFHTVRNWIKGAMTSTSKVAGQTQNV